MTIVRIFLASPADTAPAREIISQLVHDIGQEPAYRTTLRLELLRWDDPTRPVPCSFLRNPQREVVDYAGDPGDCDLVIGLFRHVFGSPLPVEDWDLSPDGDPWTGTEWELHRGIDAARNGQVREVWVYRDMIPLELASDIPDDEFERRDRKSVV